YPISPYLDAGYLFGSTQGSNLLARVTHHSANDNNVENQRFMDNDLLLKGSAYTDLGFAVDGQVDISLDNHFFYGYDRVDTTFTTEDVKHRINLVGVGAKLYNSSETQGNLNYWAGFDVYKLTNNYATKETGLLIDLGLTKWLGDHPLTVKLGTDLTRLKDTAVQKLNNFFLNPTFSFGTNAVRAKIGGRLASANEEFSFFPDVEVLLNLAGGNISVFAGAGGQLQKNNYRILSDYNPFLVSELSEIRNTHYFDLFAGVRGSLAGMEFSLQGGFKPTKDLALFDVNLEKPWIRFTVLYDTVDIVYFKGSIKGPVFRNVEVHGSIVQNIYTTEVEDKAWLLPQLQANAGVTYLGLQQKLRLKAEVFVNDAVPFQEVDFGDEPNLLFDVSLAADYYLTEHLGLFVHLNNLASTKYRRWYNYPTYGLNVLGGVTARF
ncbi:MAG: hypothetical protein OEQ53_20210, partial [Saprospiraceae bacterium]|nr:hypothetical protein [Saprospiraceae bacterium]